MQKRTPINIRKVTRTEAIRRLEKHNDPVNDPLLYSLRTMSDMQFAIVRAAILEEETSK